VSLDAGMEASESEGKPLSGKFELEDGNPQLSVYTEKASKFSEVHETRTTTVTLD